MDGFDNGGGNAMVQQLAGAMSSDAQRGGDIDLGVTGGKSLMRRT